MIMDQPVLALTPGEPSGIGPECAVRLAYQHPELRLLLVANHDLIRDTAKQLEISIDTVDWQPGDTVNAGIPACLSIPMKNQAIPGKPDPENAAYVLDCIRQAVKMVRTGHASALVTGPVHKAVINDSGIAFSGHTEFLAELAGVSRVVMMLATDTLRVALVTTHLPLRDVPDAVTRTAVEETIRITNSELKHRFGISSARLQVLGLNPHSGEGGHLGSEDMEIIAPAIEQCRADGILISGPVPADAAFTSRALRDCDAVIAMYHDQGLPVLKHAGFGKSVNITLGLPFIRTSVDHGTALDIAGQGLADASSLYHAASMAQIMSLGHKP
ncbi:MAG: 4-hydroxythreonine-4-phosphate dehydrogenase [Lysobacterales bacterium]|jgi:4-hydroxythreonine-4-phosphate dehydrogenase